ncbi:uncharacterized protein [Centruroides vittatus]|uniref:uncharacterized protein n=1 Tax=Centruroides vittatus TaxID=120091 RepID=UPI0035106837
METIFKNFISFKHFLICLFLQIQQRSFTVARSDPLCCHREDLTKFHKKTKERVAEIEETIAKLKRKNDNNCEKLREVLIQNKVSTIRNDICSYFILTILQGQIQ